MGAKITEAERAYTLTGRRITIITFSPCGHKRSIGGWNKLPSGYLGEDRENCGQGPCIKAGGRP